MCSEETAENDPNQGIQINIVNNGISNFTVDLILCTVKTAEPFL